MKRFILIILTISLMLGLAGCLAKETEKVGENSTFKTITSVDAKKRLDSEKGIILVDVRTESEYNERHIPNSILIPLDTLKSEAPNKLTDKNADIFVYCETGRRSANAAQVLADLGYKKVFNIGGLNNWPFEIEKGK